MQNLLFMAKYILSDVQNSWVCLLWNVFDQNSAKILTLEECEKLLFLIFYELEFCWFCGCLIPNFRSLVKREVNEGTCFHPLSLIQSKAILPITSVIMWKILVEGASSSSSLAHRFWINHDPASWLRTETYPCFITKIISLLHIWQTLTLICIPGTVA